MSPTRSGLRAAWAIAPTAPPWVRRLLTWFVPARLALALYRGFVGQWQAITADGGPGYAPQALIWFVVCAVSLTLQEYFGDHATFVRWFRDLAHSHYGELWAFAWWSGWRFIGYVMLPALVILAMPGERLRDYHLSVRGLGRHIWIYVAMFAAFFYIVVLMSKTAAFRHTYPFYRWANRSRFDFWAWEALYALQFFSLEFFFRGVLLQGLRKLLGPNAIFAMLVPYCMIHYGKPMPETLGAIGAGLLLGTLAMRTRSIWGGVLLHTAVAFTMDYFALEGCPPMGSGLPCRN